MIDFSEILSFPPLPTVLGSEALAASSCKIDFDFRVVTIIIIHLNNFVEKKRNPVTIKH